ncbi:MAG: hypothetical protein RLZZ226_740 [Pseudomonadota bacterium]
MKKLISGVFLSVLLPFAVHAENESNADFPVGLWHTAHFRMQNGQTGASKKPITLDVCMQRDGTWQSLKSTDGMNGRWSREGNDVHMTGNGAEFAGTGDVTLVIPYRSMTGNWQSWSIRDATAGHFSYLSLWKLAKAKSCTP